MFAYIILDMKYENETQWFAMRRDRQYLPHQLTGDRETDRPAYSLRISL